MCAISVFLCSLPVLAVLARKSEIEHYFPCGGDGRAGGVRSRDYQIFWDGQIYLPMVLRGRASHARALLLVPKMVPLLLGAHHSFAKKKKTNKKKTVVSLATFVALQVWYGIPNERVPKSPLQ